MTRQSLSHQGRFYTDFVRKSLDHHPSPHTSNGPSKMSKIRQFFCGCFTKAPSNQPEEMAVVPELDEGE